MTKDEKSSFDAMYSALLDAIAFIESGRVGEGLDWLKIAKRAADAAKRRSK